MTRALMTPLLQPQIDVFLKAGFAFFIDDIPGSGASQGTLKNVYADRTQILVEEIETLRNRSDINPNGVGVVGMSQAGIVMPKAVKGSGRVAFMIAESCVAQSAAQQDAYLLEQTLICDKFPVEEARKAGRLALQLRYADDYEAYREAAEYLNGIEIAKLLDMTGPVTPKEKWSPPDRAESNIFFDPMPLVGGFKIPVLALFGANDKNINPVQGEEDYRRALRAAGNPFHRVEMIPGANHLLFAAPTGCVRELMEQVQAGKPAYASGVLSTIASWLEELKQFLPN
jgi:alpha-beta hydrolase superfamily lysophospholipase